MEFEVEAALNEHGGSRYSLFFEHELLESGVTREIQDALVRCLREGAKLLGAVTGYLTIDVFPCPYEAVIKGEWGSWTRYEDQLRGYYWANILSRGSCCSARRGRGRPT